MKAFQAGYVPGAVWQAALRGKLSNDLDWLDVFRQLSHFVIDHDVGGNGTLPPELAVLQNILCRGVPTLPSLYLERQLERTTGLVKYRVSGQKSVSAYAFEFTEDSTDDLLLMLERAYCVVAPDGELRPLPRFAFPKFGDGEDSTEFDSKAEQIFWNGPLSNLLGAGGMQLALRQRALDTILDDDNKKNFKDKRVDVAVQLPGSAKGSHVKGIVFEVDGPRHKDPAVKIDDTRRDDACFKSDWVETYRHRLCDNVDARSAIDENHAGVARALSHPYLRRIRENFDCPLRKDELGQHVRHLALFPMAVARLQRVILELVRGGVLSIDAAMWHLVVIDRDNLTGCGVSAARDLRLWMRHLWAIYRPGQRVPIIRVCEASQSSADVQLPAKIDAVLDVSVEMRYGVTRPMTAIMEKLRQYPTVVIRSDYYMRQPHYQLAFDDPLIPQIEGAALEKALTFFLRNIFRKVDFRENQTDIIMRALKGQSVIGLLPTGAGKSITYQISALLQNGIAIVVAPIKSLMKDQDDNLKAIGISASAFINSMSSGPERRRNTGLMQRGCFKFVFVSPERFIIPEFRSALDDMRREGRVHFAYAVVDEAHCVSEWGHDFRTPYLSLGVNMRKYCHTRMAKLPLLALTGTASFEVLEDVKRELDLGQEGKITVRPDSMERENLHYRVISLATERFAADAATKRSRLLHSLGEVTQQLRGVDPTDFIGGDDGSGLVFCPHVKGQYGVREVGRALADAFPQVADKFDVYHGVFDDLDEAEGDGFDPVSVQDGFKQGRLKVLACTKAFGMGIDKPDIRFTMHFNIPQSLESFYQEAGRAGRDKEDALCWILYTGKKTPVARHSVDYELNESFHRNAFPGADLEEAKVFELLESNRSLDHLRLNELNNWVAETFGPAFSVNTHCMPENGVYQLYINHAEYRGDGKVYIDFGSDGRYTWRVKNEHKAFANHREIAKAVRYWLDSHKPSGKTWRDDFFEVKVITQPGLEGLLYQSSDDFQPPVTLAFENGYLEQIASFLGVDHRIVEHEYRYTREAGEFIVKLQKALNKAKKPLRDLDRAIPNIQKIYPKIRLREHTFRAIYRLSILGAVEDFAADYNVEAVTATIRRLPPGGYKANLRRYIHRYAPMLVDEYMAVADKCGLPTELRCCLHALIQFVYARIATQRVKAMEIMEQTTERGIHDPDEFRNVIVTFFDSKYLPDIQSHLSELTPGYVLQTCDETAGAKSALEHLLGACNRLVPENPENPALYALRAYAIALLDYPEQAVKQDLDDALSGFYKYHGWQRRERLDFLMRLRETIVRVDREKARVFDAAVIEDHARWLREHQAISGA